MSVRLISVLCVAWAAAGCTEPDTTSASKVPVRPERTLSSFGFIGPETTMQQVIATLGPADRDIGSGIHIYVYRLADGSQVLVGSPDNSEVWYVMHGPTDLYRKN